ncbi:hypothetical protein [Celeribacter sp. ULVN23_4]
MTRVTKTEREIDKIVDDLVKDDKTANELKDKLHETIEASGTDYLRSVPDVDDDADDIWDNMPV